MKLASLKHGRDGKLVVVSRDLTHAALATDITPTLQSALDNWTEISPKLEARYQALNAGEVPEAFQFNEQDCASPLPRAFQWADGSAYVNHVELVRKARGATMPESFWTDPLMYQGMSDGFLGPRETIQLADDKWGCDFEGEIAVITNDVPMSTQPENAEKHIKLLMLVNDVSLRNLIPGELAKGFGFFQSKPASAFSPVAITPDELNDAWSEGKVHLPLHVHLNGEKFGSPEAGVDMTFNFHQLVAHVAKSRHLAAGTIIGSGTVSNIDRSKGSCCLAEKRMLEIIDSGEALTPFMTYGDRVEFEMFDKDGNSLFGKIDQTVAKYQLD
ncbi:putative 2-keto-4-pentenoate hydratase/2-oxohepta-3-ene-1,7-dioic acid hydratase [Vibrio nigripulchritudo SFn27]|uniref:Putative 2-keto-4-pentenoate hydratase/2-oxohepta-3-ene-1,7-dioic acid hydratase n=2 Tax=Vibrio nigripulchritudo TaxID=28173 RepID=U4KBU4_9VIBR|nr:fumarylacetoacetate hydrolase family protein [Vibrio nigripulchritudo]CCN82413.1 putative 2-keto-4-pentenoate hydratase/2-oxohepta-3-ene-1,7-dioic acid hydratase [Vibrio nigripulchritudo BLFn1]CCN91399.1 putative 2-keto-4-pentenoate hydratase/2-oxohepta-3-ene-1,7-dioic acid hydratase [Vibrio nigripulchritudo SFn27]CCN97564.1 putative 2-keto-4-pentenoate hydratase/2-oxohepta-3-ene-1,7-dioic acid hydratase [Vibrio nigripulchritudo ENn2]CCO38706.1 putative 2-keto-4-pentenoate hydratase/2-oxohep